MNAASVAAGCVNIRDCNVSKGKAKQPAIEIEWKEVERVPLIFGGKLLGIEKFEENVFLIM